ncbi:hypothetical protein [Thaumasiovibrio subtropicus]|uniref:hypothetical protein n=1 Tax=Thaumasiovibrio subtropicus TaxID=1891207 RepID=UPI000B3558A7|nr:hypothetical protein [Thaumasiovibrio subtropicus]
MVPTSKTLKALVILVGGLAGAAYTSLTYAVLPEGDEWVWPNFETTEAKKGTLETEYHFDYRQSNVRDAAYLPTIDKEKADYSTPAKAFMSRMSALQHVDYDWWLAAWDEPSRALFQAQAIQMGRDQGYWTDLWQTQFSRSVIQIARQIEYQGYVIFTYRVMAEDRKTDIGGGFEYPIVFKQQEDASWRVSLDLRRDPLLQHSPWVSGRSRTEVALP